MLICDHWGEHDFPPDSVYHSLKKSYNLLAAYLCNANVQGVAHAGSCLLTCCGVVCRPCSRRNGGMSGLPAGRRFFPFYIYKKMKRLQELPADGVFLQPCRRVIRKWRNFESANKLRKNVVQYRFGLDPARRRRRGAHQNARGAGIVNRQPHDNGLAYR